MALPVAQIFDYGPGTGNTGRLTASADMLGFVCRKSGQGTVVARQVGNTNPSSLNVDITGYTYPIVAIRMDGYISALVQQGTVGGAPVMQFASDAPVGTMFTYYIFEWTAALPANNGLFQLFNPSTGQCTFSSSFWPMKCVSGLGMSTGTPTNNYTDNNLTFATACAGIGGHETVATFACYDSGQAVPDPDSSCKDVRGRIDGKRYGGRITNGGHSAQGVQVSFDDVLASFGNYAQSQKFGNGWTVGNTILVIDVTGIPIGQTFF